MSLPNEHTCMVDTLRKPKLINTSLKSSFQEILDLKRQHIIELHARFVKYTNTDKSANQSIAFEEPSWFFVIERQKLPVKKPSLSTK